MTLNSNSGIIATFYALGILLIFPCEVHRPWLMRSFSSATAICQRLRP